MLLDDPDIAAALQRAARRNHASAGSLRAAVEHESAGALAQALRIPLPEAGERMNHVRRVLAFGGDWGAGCRLLSDDLRDELLAVLNSW